MKREEFDEWESRVRARAEVMWQDAGRPEGGPDRFVDQAREWVALSEVLPATLDPDAGPVIEESSIQRNLGEFPTLVDQGDEQTFPDEIDQDDEIMSSDGDASDEGGVLPAEDVAQTDMPDASVADGDVASSSTAAEDADDDAAEDLNDDGVRDEPSFQDYMKDEDE